ncbi:30S ribosome-binding factor RbfA [Candidatus Gracilibacteria bacterium]|nr:30S ribosome-binding factor RbfA [Candidatus Gracilibacteria bacterium]
MNQERIRKLESVSRELVSHYILEELDDSELTFGIITVTGVKISSDLSYLDIFVSSLHNGEILPKTLAKHNKEIQGRFNRALNIRKLPKIRFRYDNKGAIGQEVCELIKSI